MPLIDECLKMHTPPLPEMGFLSAVTAGEIVANATVRPSIK